MRPEALTPDGQMPAIRLTPDWRAACLRLGLACLALIVLFGRDWLAMFAQWWDSSTYNHILLVPAIVAWLVWQRLPEVLKLQPRGWSWGLVPLGLALFGWVLGRDRKSVV